MFEMWQCKILPSIIYLYYVQVEPLKKIEEAAMVDGCTRFKAFLQVIIPFSGPGLVAVSAFSFLSAWNEFFMALIFIGANTKTIIVTVTEFSPQFGVDYGLMATGDVIGSIPTYNSRLSTAKIHCCRDDRGIGKGISFLLGSMYEIAFRNI